MASLVPGRHDGMAAFAGAHGRVILMRNHELYAHNVKSGAFGTLNTRLRRVAREKTLRCGTRHAALSRCGNDSYLQSSHRQGGQALLEFGRHVAQLFWGADSVGHVG